MNVLNSDSIGTSSDHFIPDLCQPKGLLVILLLVLVLSMTYSLARYEYVENLWAEFGTTAFFLTWLGLLDAAVLCAFRRHARRLSGHAMLLICYLALLGITALVTEFGYWFLTIVTQRNDIGHVQIHLINEGIAAILFAALLRYFYIQTLWKNQLIAANEAKFQALQARIRPHFLFNSLNTIAALTEENPAQAERAIEYLSELFRASLDESTLVSIGEELAFCKQYIALEKLRVGSRLEVIWNIDETAEELMIPRLILQPLLENAVYHGIETLAEGGCIEVTCVRQESSTDFKITNPTGFVEISTSGHALAVTNIQARLNVLFGKRAMLSINHAGGCFIVQFQIPVIHRP